MFEIMATEPNVCDLPSNSGDEGTCSVPASEDNEKQTLLFSTENEITKFDDAKDFHSDDSAEIKGRPSMPASPASNPGLKAKNATEKKHTSARLDLNSKHLMVNDSENKENTAVCPASTTTGM